MSTKRKADALDDSKSDIDFESEIEKEDQAEFHVEISKLYERVDNLNNEIQANNETLAHDIIINNQKAEAQIENIRKEFDNKNSIIAKEIETRNEELKYELTKTLEEIKEISNSVQSTLMEIKEERKNQDLVNKMNQEKYEQVYSYCFYQFEYFISFYFPHLF